MGETGRRASDTPSSAPSRPAEPEVLGHPSASSAREPGQIGHKPGGLQVGDPAPSHSVSSRAPRAGAAHSASPGTAPRPGGGEGPLPTSVGGCGSTAGTAFFPNRSVNGSVRWRRGLVDSGRESAPREGVRLERGTAPSARPLPWRGLISGSAGCGAGPRDRRPQPALGVSHLNCVLLTAGGPATAARLCISIPALPPRLSKRTSQSDFRLA